MFRVLSLTFLALTATSGHASSVIDLLENQVGPSVACYEEPKSELAEVCIQDLCKDTKTALPMVVTDPREFFDKSQHVVPPSIKEGFKTVIKERIKELNLVLDEIEKADLSATLSDEEKFDLVYGLYQSSCVQQISAKAVKVTCKNPALENSPAKSVFTAYVKELFRNNWNDSLLMKFYTYAELPKLMTPAWKAKIATRFNDLTQDQYEFITENLNRFETLSPLDKIRFVKIVSFLQPVPEPSSAAEKAAINKHFGSLVKIDGFKKDLKSIREKVNAPAFYNTALASLETQHLLGQMAPTADELEQLNKTEAQIKDKVLTFQKEQGKPGKMSEGSFAHYSEELDKVRFNYKAGPFDTSGIRPANLPFFQAGKKEILRVIIGKQTGGLFEFVGAGLGSRFPLVNDQYIDPMFRNINDPDFGTSEVKFSLFSLKNPDFGKQILTHELGHHFSYLHLQGRLSDLTAKEVSKSKACIVSRFEDTKAGEQYLEEDFSDEWTYALHSDSDPLYFCPLLQEIKDPEFYSLELGRSTDLHSPVLWRVLNQFKSLSKRPLPDACTKLIEKSPYQYKKCL